MGSIESTEATLSSSEGDSQMSSSTEASSSSEGDSSMSSTDQGASSSEEGYSRIKRQKVNQTENGGESSQSRKPQTIPLQPAHGSITPLVEETLNLKKPSVTSSSKVSSAESCIISVQGYKVKNTIAPILKAIFMKHGDIAAECVFKTECVRASFLELVCEVVKQLQIIDDLTVVSKLEEIQNKVSEAKAANIHISWLQSHLDAFHKRKEAMETSSLLISTKAKTSMVKKSAEMDLKERYAELIVAHQQFKKAERCVKVLGLVEKKLHNNIWESKTEQDSWERPPNVID